MDHGHEHARRQALHRKRVKERMRELQEEVAQLRKLVGKQPAARSSVTVPDPSADEIVARATDEEAD
jgi:hypothetical protein